MIASSPKIVGQKLVSQGGLKPNYIKGHNLVRLMWQDGSENSFNFSKEKFFN